MTEEDRVKRAFAGTGWNVRWNDGWFWRIFKNDGRYDYRSVVLESPDGAVLVNVGTTGPSSADHYGRDYVFATAAADMSGEPRPYGKTWVNAVGYLADGGELAAPGWYGRDGACLVSSVEEFAFKLSVLGWGGKNEAAP